MCSSQTVMIAAEVHLHAVCPCAFLHGLSTSPGKLLAFLLPLARNDERDGRLGGQMVQMGIKMEKKTIDDAFLGS